MEILGNKKNLDLLKEAFASGRLSHAYLISGPQGSGKKTFAFNAAAGILCENGKAEGSLSLCGRCPSCRRALSGNHPDIIRITHEKKNTLSVDEIRDQLVRDVDIKPYYGPYKIYIIPDSDLMPVQAQNALLKTLEEPPAYVLIFLLADNAGVLSDTIKSRSIRLDMEALPDETVTAQLRKAGSGEKEAALIAAFCAGNLGQALELYKNEAAKELLDECISFISTIGKKDALQISAEAALFSESELLFIPDVIRRWYRDILVLRSISAGRLYFPGRKDELKAAAGRLSYESINNIFKETDEACERLKFNVNPKAVYEALLLRIRSNDQGYRD